MEADVTGEDEEIAAAEAEVTARAENEELEAAAEAGWDLMLVSYGCECGDPDCPDEVRMTVEEYEEIRENPRRFAIVPGHVFPAAEHVIEHHSRYEVVEKHSEAGAIAEATDPRT